MRVRRGDIYIADLGSDSIEAKRGVRPILIVQNNVGNSNSDSYVAAVITSRKKTHLPTHVELGGKCGLRRYSVCMCENLVTVKDTMLRKFVGSIVNTQEEQKVNHALAVSLQLKEKET